MSVTLDDMITLVRDSFGGVARRLGLRGPNVVRANNYFCLRYFGQSLGLELLVEFDNFFVYAMPFRMPENGGVPNLLLGPNGEVRQMYLHEALDKLGLSHEREHRELRRLGGDYRNCAAMVTLLGDVLERTWPAIQSDAAMLFPDGGARNEA